MTDQPTEAAIEVVGNVLMDLDLFDDMNDVDDAARRLASAVWDLAVAQGRQQAAQDIEEKEWRYSDPEDREYRDGMRYARCLAAGLYRRTRGGTS